MANVNQTNFDGLLKQLTVRDRIDPIVYTDFPLLGMLTKNESMRGNALKVPVIYSDVQGGSHTFSSAQTNRTGIGNEAFLVTRAKDYVSVGVDGETIEASQGDEASFIAALQGAIDSGFRTAAGNLERELFGDGNTYRGQVGSGQASTTITLADTEEIVNFEVGMVLKGVNGGSLRSGSATVGEINRDSGTLTTSSGNNWNSDITSLAANDYLVRDGDWSGSAGLGLKGLKAWVPTSAPTSTTFFGVDRTTDTTRLGGIRYTASGAPVQEAVYAAQMRAAREGAMVDTCFLSVEKFKELNISLDSKRQYTDVVAKTGSGSTARIGYRAVLIEGYVKPIKVFATRHLKNEEGYLLTMDRLKLGSMGPAPRVLDHDGLRELRIYNDDAIELRIGYYANLYTDAPGAHVYMNLA